MKKIFRNCIISILLLHCIVFTGYSQIQLSNDALSAQFIEVTGNPLEFQLDYQGNNINDIPNLHCDRAYPGISSYFYLEMPSSGIANINVEYEISHFSGIALYRYENGQYIELGCNSFNSKTVNYVLDESDLNLNNEIIIVRLWSVDEIELMTVNITISDEKSHEYILQRNNLIIEPDLYTPEELVYDHLISGCVEAMNVSYTGHDDAIGYFDNGINLIGLTDGVILSTGNVADAVGPNSSGSTSSSMSTPGDADLQNLVNGTTYDAAILEFNFIPASNQIEFNYVFASDEYPQYANSNFNDVFAFFLSGGPENYNNYNIALLPGLSTPVTINNVNHTNNTQFYINNHQHNSPYTNNPINIEYDGFTVPLTAVADVTMCETYHIKMGIADVWDSAFDSAVFIEAGSFVSGEGVDVNVYNTYDDALPVMQGCSHILEFCRTDDSSISSPLEITFTVGGTATPGSDYTEFEESYEIPAGQMCIQIPFSAYVTGSNNIETIIIYSDTGCPCDDSQEFIIEIHPPCGTNAQIIADNTICEGESVNINLDISSSYPEFVDVEWSTGSTNQTGIEVSPTQTTEYSVTVHHACGFFTESVTIVVNENPTVNLGPDVEICQDDSHTFDAGSGYSYNWSNGATTQTINVISEGTYSVTITDSNGCTDESSVDLTVHPLPDASASNTGPYCMGETINLNAQGGNSYSWTGPAGFTSNNQNPSISNSQMNHVGNYTVTVQTQHGCEANATTAVNIDTPVDASIDPVDPVCEIQNPFDLNAVSDGGTWSGDGITSANNGTFNPSVAGVGQHTIYYNVENGECSDSDQIVIQVDEFVDGTINPIDALCISYGDITLTAATSGGVWSGTGIVNQNTGLFNTSVAGAGNHQISYSLESGACSDANQITIVVDEDVDATITPVETLCSSDGVIILSAVSSGGAWSGNGITNPTEGTFSPSTAGAGTHNIEYSVENGACSDFDEIQISIDEDVDATITPIGPFCIIDGNVQIEAAMPGGEWTGNGIIDSNNGDFSPSVAGAGNHNITYEIQNGVCVDIDQINITVYEDVDASITPIGPFCVTDPPQTLTAASSGGQWSGSGVSNNVFNPANAQPGVHTINYDVTNGECSDSDQTTIEVFEAITVLNFMDTTCNDINTEFYVTFDVENNEGQPASFIVYWEEDGTVYSDQFSGNYTGAFESPGPYNITVTDINEACSEYVYTGFRDCGCATFAGTMESLQLVSLCDGACTDMVGYNDNYVFDADDTHEFILHSGGFPATPLAINDTPEFCFYDIAGLELGQIYYISAIAGDELPNGHVDVDDNCYSQSQGTPVVWYESPVAHINHGDLETCGLEISLEAEPAPSNLYGSWSADDSFYPVGSSSVFDNEIDVMVGASGTVTFTWSVHDGPCYGSAEVEVDFNPTPTAYAGENFAVCGLSADLEAVLSLPGQSNGQWMGEYSFSPETDPQATVNVNTYGQHTFTWQESVGDCSTIDQVTVTFIEEPNPTITNLYDTVCGSNYNLLVHNVNGTGSWTAYIDGTVMVPSPTYIPNENNPYTSVSIGSYNGLYEEVEFVWTEQFQQSGVQCFGSASQNVVFSLQPYASVGPNDEMEICGNCVSFEADTTGSGWANGTWVNTSLSTTFEDNNPNIPNASVCIDPLGSYGDSAYVRTPFLWVLENYGCTSVDTMWVTFYKRPNANAGLDNAVCGNHYELGAVYNLSQSNSYFPSGVWSTHEAPETYASATISPQHGDSVNVTVSHYGSWQFLFRENNSNATFCYDTDTVTIEFVEIPIVDAGEDKHVCGTCTQLEASSSGFYGTWLDNGASYDNYEDPNTNTCVNSYGGINFVWSESNHAETQSLACTSRDTVKINFWRVPQPTILTDEADSTTCGLTFNNLRAQQPGTGIEGYWWNDTDPDPVYGNPLSHNTNVTVNTYGYHDFYWVATNGPTLQPDFCVDTAGPLTIRFIEIPNANAGGDTLFCGHSGSLSAIPSFGTGVWSTPSTELVTFSDINDPNSQIDSDILNTGNATNPYFNIIWTEDNTNGCTDHDTIKVVFARVPSSEINIVPPKCFGEKATISANEDTLSNYSWNFFSGIIADTVHNIQGGNFENFVYWENENDWHTVSLVTTNYWGCQSLVAIDTVYEPHIPDFEYTIHHDTCLLGLGAIILHDTLGTTAFYWMNEEIGPRFGVPIESVYDLPEGSYDINVTYRTPNQHWYNYYINTFGSANCSGVLDIEIEPIGMLEAGFDIDASINLDELVVPEAEVLLNNMSDYDGVRRRCIWHFGDGNTLTSCDEQVEHVYTEPGCYDPFLIVMNRDLQECRDTAFIDLCINVENQSEIEVPNIFTPNGDGINDFFQVKAQTLRSFRGTILNRWGTAIYEWTNWQDEEAGWDGNLPGGTKATSGVYYYVIIAEGLDDVDYEFTGALHLMRD